MKIVINFEKKHLYFLLIFLVVLGVGVVIATTHGDAQSHPILYTNTIEGRDQASITVNDDLTIATGKNLCLNGVCNSAWPAGTAPVGWTEDVVGNKIYTTTTTRNVGIGTTTPNTKLQVNGDIRFGTGTGAKLTHLTGSSPSCVSSFGFDIIAKKWNTRTCTGNNACSTGTCPSVSCTVNGGWGSAVTSCTYYDCTQLGISCINGDAHTCTPSTWSEVFCITS